VDVDSRSGGLLNPFGDMTAKAEAMMDWMQSLIQAVGKTVAEFEQKKPAMLAAAASSDIPDIPELVACDRVLSEGDSEDEALYKQRGPLRRHALRGVLQTFDPLVAPGSEWRKKARAHAMDSLTQAGLDEGKTGFVVITVILMGLISFLTQKLCQALWDWWQSKKDLATLAHWQAAAE